ncbi:Protein-glutamine gamma-glutamyltransferase [Gossypium arboreum]|uniref:Protein-glutamine gamma-glutamyltransferase n=1 Tax=Gossypium arboreum TaxID=29729 RepID=A0A0B0NL31_GOSAR|nr:Protein-glutamine gamma-glutamyltransferase [Gossypium arboreum]
MGKQDDLDFPTRACHMVVSFWQGQSTIYMGRSHTYAHLIAVTTGVSHGRVPSEPKFSPI